MPLSEKDQETLEIFKGPLTILNQGIQMLPDAIRGQVSDGYHTTDELYEHRVALWIALCRQYFKRLTSTPEGKGMHTHYKTVWRSRRHSGGELAYGGGWFVLGIHHEAGKQLTYHLPEAEWDNCAFAEELERAPEFDGHFPTDVLIRLAAL